MTKSLTALALAALAAMPAHAAVSLTADDLDYSQSFNTLATSGTANPWVNDSTLVGWSLIKVNSTAPAPVYSAGIGSSNTGSFYSFGSANATDRALGGIASSNATGYWGSVIPGTTAGYIALALQNNTGKSIDSFTLAYTGEQWRDGGATAGAAQPMKVEYGFGSSFANVATWSNLNSLTFTSPTFTAPSSGASLNGNAAANRNADLSQTVQSLDWSNGNTLWVRWVEVNDSGNDHGLAIDDVTFSATVSAVPEPQAYALMLGGLGLIGWMARRRKA